MHRGQDRSGEGSAPAFHRQVPHRTGFVRPIDPTMPDDCGADRAGAGHIRACVVLQLQMSRHDCRCRCRSGRFVRDSRRRERCHHRDWPRLRGKGRQRRRTGRCGEVSSAVMCVAWIRHQRSSTNAWSNRNSTGRIPVAAMQSSTSRCCSATWMWIGVVLVDAADERPDFVRRRSAQRVYGEAKHGFCRCAPAGERSCISR